MAARATLVLVAVLVAITIVAVAYLVWSSHSSIPGREAAKPAATATVTATREVLVDVLGRRIVVHNPPKRVVSLAPSITETVCMLGCCGRLVGVDSFSNYPPQVVEWVKEGRVTVVGGYWNPSPEKIMVLEPDLVLASASVPSHRGLLKVLQGVAIAYVHGGGARSLDEIVWDISFIGSLLGCPGNATRLINVIKSTVANVTETLAKVNATRVPVLVVLGAPEWGVWAAGGGTYLDDLVKLAGGVNVASRYHGWVRLGSEELASLNPTIVLAAVNAENSSEAVKILEKWMAVLNVTGAREYCVAWGPADDVLSRPGPRVTVALGLLAHLLHPNLFTMPREVDGYVYCMKAGG